MKRKKQRKLTQTEIVILFHLFRRGVPQCVTSKFLGMSRAHVCHRYKLLKNQGVEIKPIGISLPKNILRLEGLDDLVINAGDGANNH